jgi:uncharacterized DUF497 family protein
MNFEFDPAKSLANQQKHGIDFFTAQQLWEDTQRLEVPARSENEPRRMLIAKLRGKLWTAIFTLRAANVRIISVRRSRDEEKYVYEQTK